MRWRWLPGVALTVAIGVSTTLAAMAQDAPKPADKDADLPPEIRALTFEIKDGFRKFTTKCLSCHDVKKIEQANYSLFLWQDCVSRMSKKPNANISRGDQDAIFLYLAYRKEAIGKTAEKAEYLAFLQKCEGCHGVNVCYKMRHPLKDWPGIISRMAVKPRAAITPEDETMIMNYVKRMHTDLHGVD